MRPRGSSSSGPSVLPAIGFAILGVIGIALVQPPLAVSTHKVRRSTTRSCSRRRRSSAR